MPRDRGRRTRRERRGPALLLQRDRIRGGGVRVRPRAPRSRLRVSATAAVARRSARTRRALTTTCSAKRCNTGLIAPVCRGAALRARRRTHRDHERPFTRPHRQTRTRPRAGRAERRRRPPPAWVTSTARTAASGRGAEPAQRLLLAATNHELEQQVVVGVDDQDRAVTGVAHGAPWQPAGTTQEFCPRLECGLGRGTRDGRSGRGPRAPGGRRPRASVRLRAGGVPASPAGPVRGVRARPAARPEGFRTRNRRGPLSGRDRGRRTARPVLDWSCARSSFGREGR